MISFTPEIDLDSEINTDYSNVIRRYQCPRVFLVMPRYAFIKMLLILSGLVLNVFIFDHETIYSITVFFKVNNKDA